MSNKKKIVFALVAVFMSMIQACNDVGVNPVEDDAPNRPNVIIVNIDNHEKSALSYYGNKLTEMPALDKLAATSVRFENYHTASRCAPSRAALMTGLYHHRTGSYGTFGASRYMKTGIPTMGDFFKKAGYKTGLFGKWHLGGNYQYRPEDRGFDEVVAFVEANVGIHSIDGKGKRSMKHIFRHNKEWEKYDGFRSDVWFHEMQRFIKESVSQDNGPFLAYLATLTQHARQAGPEELSQKYRRKLDAMDLSSMSKEEKAKTNYVGITVLEQAIEVAAELECIDQGISETLALLEELGELDNTIFIYMSDGTGSHLPRAGLMKPEGNIGREIPMTMSWAGGNLKNGAINEHVANIDVLPTLMDICGVHAPQDYSFDGQSFYGLIKEGKTPWKPRVYVQDMQSHRDKGLGHFYKPFVSTRLFMPEGIVYWGSSPHWGDDDLPPEAPAELIEKGRIYYEKWFDEVTGGGEPMTNYLEVGTQFENPSYFHTAHYLIKNGPAGEGEKQYFPIEFTTAGRYTFSDVSDFPPGSGKTLKEGINVKMNIEGEVYEGQFPLTLPVEPGQYLVHVEDEEGKPFLHLRVEKKDM